jgi:cation transport ATPase
MDKTEVEKDARRTGEGRLLSREELVDEARKQTNAIQHLAVWQRLGYSLLAVGFLLGYWGFYGGGGTVAGVVGVVMLVVGTPVSLVLRVGIGHAKTNVKHLLAAAGVDLSEKSDAGKEA